MSRYCNSMVVCLYNKTLWTSDFFGLRNFLKKYFQICGTCSCRYEPMSRRLLQVEALEGDAI